LALSAQTTASFCKKLIITLDFDKNVNFLPKIGKNQHNIVILTLVFEKKTPIFRRKLAKIAEYCDLNIDPWSGATLGNNNLRRLAQ
jgi:hypothetical protein